MTSKFAAAAVDGFKGPFRLTFAIASAIVAAFTAFVLHASPPHAQDSRMADYKDSR